MNKILKYLFCAALISLLWACAYKITFSLVAEQDGLRVNHSYEGFWKGYFNDNSYINLNLKPIRKNVWSCRLSYHSKAAKTDTSLFLRAVPFSFNKERLVQIQTPDNTYYIIKVTKADKDKIYFQYIKEDYMMKAFKNQTPDKSGFSAFLKTNLDSVKIWSNPQPLLRGGSMYDQLHSRKKGF